MKVEGIEAVLWKIAYRSALEAMGKDELTSDDMKHYAQTIFGAPEEGTCEARRHGRLGGMPSFVCLSCSVCGYGWHTSEYDKPFSYCPNCGRRVVEE